MKKTILFCLLTAFTWSAHSAIIDQIGFADPKSEKAHTFSATGSVSSEPIQIEIGTFRENLPARTLKGKDAPVCFELSVSDGTGPALLEIQEVHDRRPQIFGYTVLVNGKEIYFRIYNSPVPTRSTPTPECYSPAKRSKSRTLHILGTAALNVKSLTIQP